MLQLSGYQISGLLSSGGRWKVFRGLRTDGLQPVLIKVARDEYATSQYPERLRREFERGRRLAPQGGAPSYLALEHHEHGIALILDDDGAAPLVGQLPRGGADLTTCHAVARGTAEGLWTMHQRGLVHDDLSPSCIMVHPTSLQTRLLHLGAACSRHEIDFADGGVAQRLHYVAPERTGRLDRTIDERSDLYSLGVALYQLLTGHLPFPGEDLATVLHAQLAREATDVRELRPDAPKSLCDVVHKLLAKDPDDRYVSARGLIADLVVCQRIHDSGEVPRSFSIGGQDLAQEFRVSTRLYGREVESKALEDAFKRCVSGAFDLVLVSGASGVGKTSVVDHLEPTVFRSGAHFGAGKFDELHRGKPYAALLTALTRVVDLWLGQPEAQLSELRARTHQALGPNAALLTTLLPALEHLLGKSVLPPQVPPEESQARFQHAFLELLRALPSAAQPLVLFIDDLQWADEASIGVLERLCLAAPRHLLVVAAFRTDETDARLREFLQRAAASFAERMLTVGSLDVRAVAALLADTLARTPREVQSLATICVDKTDANPFALAQFLAEAHNLGMFRFHDESGAWRWDEAGVRNLDVTANVAELLARRIRRLPPDVRTLLTVAACAGSSSDVTTLANVMQLPLQLVLDRALVAARERLLLATTDTPEGGTHFRFAHDRVRAAAYSLSSASERSRLHAAFAGVLLQDSRTRSGQERVFELAYHLRESAELDPERTQALRRETYLAAARRAKASAAWKQACEFLEQAVALIREEDWDTNYDLALVAHQELAEAAYLSHDFERMDAAIEVVLARATEVLDQARAYEIRVLAQTARNQLVDAVQTAVHVLRLLGVRLPRKPNRGHVLVGLGRTRFRLRGRRARTIPTLREITDPRARAAMRILRSIATPAYLAMPDMMPLTMFAMIELTLRHGLCPDSAEGFNGYGVIMLAALDDLDQAHEMGELTLELARRFESQGRFGATLRNYNLFFRHWRQPARSALQPLVEAHRVSLEAGDIESATVSAVTHCFYSLFCGQPLEEVEEATLRFTEVVRVHRQERFLEDLALLSTVCGVLRRERIDPGVPLHELLGEGDELERRRSTGDTSGVANLAYVSAFVHFLFGHHDRALELCGLCEQNLQGVAGTMYPPMFHFLNALVRIAAGRCGPARDAPSALSAARASHARLLRWSSYAPANLAHKVALVEAELARAERADARAMDLYDRAIELAGHSDFTHELALAAELAARFYASRGRARIALHYLKEARHAYLAWGATSKVAALDAEFPELVPWRASQAPGDELDARAVVRASQAISSEIFRDQLLHRLMAIVMENAGAERAALVLGTVTSAEVVATVEAATGSRVDARHPLDESSECCAAIVHWVLRTKESVVLRDATREGAFRGDGYLTRRRAQSVLCIPILIAGNVGGALYLENNLVRGVFTPARIGVLSVIAAQAGISMENASLIQRLEREAVVRNNLLRFFPTSMVSRIMQDKLSLEPTETEVTAVFCDISGFSELAAKTPPRELVDILNAYFPALADVVFRHEGVLEKYIGDAMLSVWGAPFRDPLDADRALAAAVEMQRAVRHLNERWVGRHNVQIHIGLNTGQVAAGNIGSERYVQFATIGDATNVASRICELAKPGEVLLSEATRARLRQSPFTIDALAPVVLRGKPGPVSLHRVRWD